LFGFLFEILNFFTIDFEKPGAYGPGCQYMTLIHFTLFCLKMGNYPGLCIEQMHTTSIYVIYSTKINKKKGLHQLYKLKSPNKGVKALSNQYNSRRLDKALCPGDETKQRSWDSKCRVL
jgi:hypothetical protein